MSPTYLSEWRSGAVLCCRSGMNLMDIRTHKWSQPLLDATCSNLAELLGEPALAHGACIQLCRLCEFSQRILHSCELDPSQQPRISLRVPLFLSIYLYLYLSLPARLLIFRFFSPCLLKCRLCTVTPSCLFGCMFEIFESKHSSCLATERSPVA